MSGSTPILWTYLCLAVFVVAAALRVGKYLIMPVHLRWELYPVKHEAGKRADYGGSYLEETNWWTKERKSSLYNEMKFMIPEILFIRGLWEENRKLWWVSFPFHFGLYMLIGTFGLLVLGAISMLFGASITPDGGAFSALIYFTTILFGFLGITLGTLGSAGLIVRRLTDPELKPYTSLADLFNLVMFFAFFIAALATWLFFDHAFIGARAYIYSLFTFGGLPEGFAATTSVLGTITVILASFLTAYIPLTHMSHMFMKYFMYHEVRWQDEPNLKGSKLEAKILGNLGFKPTWSAPHIKGDGTKTWVDLATSTGLEEEK